MKVLVSAVACTPYHGSENYVGWAAVKALARDHEVWVLTGQRNVEYLQRAAAEGLVPANVHFAFAGKCSPWHPNRMRARLQGWREYLNFSKAILPVARQLHHQEKFDVAHHVTFVTWRVASPLGDLGIPFVFGPVGGYEQFPPRLLPILSPATAAFEVARMTSNVISRFSPGVRRCLRNADHVVVANVETERLVKAVRRTSVGVSTLSAAFYSSSEIEAFSRFAEGKNLTGPLRLFAAGNMEGRKGVALALEALAEAGQKGLQFQYRLGASGPEAAHLKKLTSRLGLQDKVSFGEGLQGEAYRRELGNTHIFLLPSLRESAGLTMMEAMLAGAVPVVADCGGPASIVTNDSGYKIPITSRHRMVQEMAEILVAIDRNRQLLAEKGRAASARIAAGFSEDNYRKTIKGIYQSVTGRFLEASDPAPAARR
jgi:glycosyltransferase involved in cell wall biosynthesis